MDITDPHQVPVTFINQVAGSGFLNGVLNLTLATARFTPIGDAVEPDLIVSSRLRMDLYCAQQLRDMLTEIIDKNTAAPKVTN